MTDFRDEWVNWRAEDTAIDIHHEPTRRKEFCEDLVEVRALSDVPLRLSVVHGNNTVKLRWGAIPGRAVGKVSANKRGDLTNGATGDVFGNYFSNHHIAECTKLLTVTLGDPLIITQSRD
jgi:hypothetical protein